MSNKNRVNPDHYKVAGRDPQGEDFTPDLNRQAFGREIARLRHGRTATVNFIPGAAPVGEAPPNGAVRRTSRRSSGRAPGTGSRRGGTKGGAKKVSAKTAGARKTVGKKAPAKKAGSARRSTRSR